MNRDREATGWAATTGRHGGDVVRDVMLGVVEQRFSTTMAAQPNEWLSDNGSAYIDHPKVDAAIEEVPPFRLLMRIDTGRIAPPAIPASERKYAERMLVAHPVGIRMPIDGRMKRHLGVKAVGRPSNVDAQALALPDLSLQMAAGPIAAAIAAMANASPLRIATGKSGSATRPYSSIRPHYVQSLTRGRSTDIQSRQARCRLTYKRPEPVSRPSIE